MVYPSTNWLLSVTQWNCRSGTVFGLGETLLWRYKARGSPDLLLRSDCVTERGATQLGSSLGFPAHQFVCSAWKAPNRLDLLSAIFLTSYLGVLEAEKLDSCHLGRETVATRLLVVSW